jgi:hypothetical protein
MGEKIMHKFYIVGAFAIAATPGFAQVPDAEYQIAAAEMALPSSLKAHAEVVGVDANGERAVLRQGHGTLSCEVSSLSRGENTGMLNVWCTPSAMGPIMERLDELRAQGDDRESATATIRSEIENGTLEAPATPATGYAFRGPAESYGEAITGGGWQLVFVPIATGEDLGLPNEPEGSMPWVMAGGTPFSHIMVFGDPSDEE